MEVNQVVVTLQHPTNAKQFLTYLVLAQNLFCNFFLYSLFISKMNSSQNPMIELSRL